MVGFDEFRGHVCGVIEESGSNIKKWVSRFNNNMIDAVWRGDYLVDSVVANDVATWVLTCMDNIKGRDGEEEAMVAVRRWLEEQVLHGARHGSFSESTMANLTHQKQLAVKAGLLEYLNKGF